MKKFIALFLAFSLVVSGAALSAFAADKRTDCNGDCEYYPTVIIPGLGQSNVWVLDENGEFVLDSDGNKCAAFPAYLQVSELVKTLIGPAVKSIITQRDIGFSDAAAKAIGDAFGINSCDEYAQPSDRVYVERYYCSLAECTEQEKETCYHHVPLNQYETDYPEDHLYYFTYNSFGNHIDIVDELYDYIHMVMEQTGHDKVIISPISQGGSIANGLFEYHPDIMDNLYKVLFIVPALDGSTIVGDAFNDRIRFLDADVLYNGFLSTFFDDETSSMIEVLLRILPDEVVMTALEKAAQVLVRDVMTTSTGMWALCPSGDYPTAAEKYLSDRPEIKKQTDKYYQAQLNSDKNIQKLLDKGVQVFNVAEYDTQMYGVGYSYDKGNADGIIQLDSTSMGAYAANVGETLPDDYVQKNTYCSNPEHNHISPDRVVDASAGLLPDTTFYFKGQKHEQTAMNAQILTLARRLLENDNIKDVYSSPDFPQFNTVESTEADGEPSFVVKLSDFLYEYFGTNGFSELPWIAMRNTFSGIREIFN